MVNYGEENARLFLVGNWEVLKKQREGHLRDGTESLETQKPSRERWEWRVGTAIVGLINWSYDQKGGKCLKFEWQRTDSLGKSAFF